MQIENHKYIINVDWLEISLHGQLSEEFKQADNYVYGGFTFTLIPGKRTAQFTEIHNVYYESVLLGTVCLKPFENSPLDKKLIKFKLENRLLYEYQYYEPVLWLCEATKWKFNNITRLDICCDLVSFKYGLMPQDFITKFQHNEIRKQDKGRPASWNVYGVGKNKTGLRFGSGASDRMLVFYNKTEELKKTNKDYIVKSHLETFGENSEVWRVEMRLKNEELKRLFNVKTGEFIISNLIEILKPENIAALFKNEFENYLQVAEFIPNTEIGAKIDLIDFDNTYYPELARFTTKSPNKLFRVKLAIKALLEEYYITTEESYLIEAIKYIKNYSLKGHIHKRFKHWLADFKGLQKMGFEYQNILEFIGLDNSVYALETTETYAGNTLKRKIKERILSCIEEQKNVYQYWAEQTKKLNLEHNELNHNIGLSNKFNHLYNT